MTCETCDRLRAWCKKISFEKKKSHLNEIYWGKPVASFGDPDAKVLIVGLAPAAHGANRTGRMFTGDNSGVWLYRALFDAGFSSQSESKNSSDDLVLSNIYITAVAHCAPPDNKPTKEEIKSCSSFLQQELHALKKVNVILALGSIAWNAVFDIAKEKGWVSKKEKFGHGVVSRLGKYTIIGSYHPSQQNTFTKRLTREMFDAIFTEIKTML